MLFPYSSDAPLYHWPYATVGLIVVNLALFFAWPYYELNQESFDQLMEERAHITEEEFKQLDAFSDWRTLHFGHGLNPVQWFFANFMHADIVHVGANMLFLWAMGIVIEGKVGWWKFLLIYLGIGVVGYGLVQIMMLGANPGCALGASLPIFGLIVLAMLWAPVNDFQCFLFLGMFSRLLELPIYLFALIYLAIQVLTMFFSGLHMSSEFLHLTGALVGLPIGVVMLQRKLVDCEHYDAFSVWRGEHELTRDERREKEEASPQFQAKVSNKRELMLLQIQAIIEEQKNPALAWTAHERMTHRFADWSLPRPLFYSIVRLYHQQGRGSEAVPAMFAYVRTFPLGETIDVRLKLAEVLMRGDRPRQGLHLLARLDPTQLSEQQRTAIAKLETYGQRRRQEVELEPAVEDL